MSDNPASKTTKSSNVVISNYTDIILNYFKLKNGETNAKNLRMLLEINSDRGVEIMNKFIDENYSELKKLVSQRYLEDFANVSNLSI